MGLFSKLKKKEKKEETVEETNIELMGWTQITNAFENLYPEQKNPKHYGTLIKWNLGGNDPLDGISIYDGGDYWHFVTYGLSEIYEKENENKDVSGYGMEFTLKLKKDSTMDEEKEIKGICGILQNIARMTFLKGEIFNPNEYLYTGQKKGMDTQMKSNITGFITVSDPLINYIDTPNGRVDFVEFIGVTYDEIESVKRRKLTVKELYEKLASDITSYNRDSVVESVDITDEEKNQ